MEEVSVGDPGFAVLYNSPLETGLRALALLDAFHPRAFDLTELTWFDHLVVHTADVDGPPSLHPDLSPRVGELMVRRTLIERSLRLMRQTNLVEMRADEAGIRYVAGDDAMAFLEMLQAPYNLALKDRASWLSERFGGMGREEIERTIADRIGRWTAEFQSGEQSDERRT